MWCPLKRVDTGSALAKSEVPEARIPKEIRIPKKPTAI
jgi:hypothetical protein